VGASVIVIGVCFYKQAGLAKQITHVFRRDGLDIKNQVGGLVITSKTVQEFEVDAIAFDGQEARKKVLTLPGYE
jgi:hypothetical protein